MKENMEKWMLPVAGTAGSTVDPLANCSVGVQIMTVFFRFGKRRSQNG